MGQTVQSLQAVTQTVTIAMNGNLSNGIDLEVQRLSRIGMPTGWDAAVLTFQVSSDGNTWRDFYDSTGNEYKVTVAANHAVLVPYADFVGVRYIRVRSGTGATPVNQTAARSIDLVTQ